MDELGFNKIAGAILATALGVMVLREVPHFFMHTDAPETPVYSVGAIDLGAGEEEAIDLPFPQQSWVDAMNADDGAQVFKKCQSCHNVESGGANGTGPGLYGVVGNPAGSHPGFNYSSAMSSVGYNWTYEELDAFLTKPAAHISGTKMAFIGLKKEEDRAAVIEYLRVNDSSPEPRPEAVAAPEPEEPTDMAEDMSAEGAEAEGAEAENSEAAVTDESGETVESSTEESTVDPSESEEESSASENETTETTEPDSSEEMSEDTEETTPQ